MEQEAENIVDDHWLPVHLTGHRTTDHESSQKLRTWALVLESRGFQWHLKSERGVWQLLVPAESFTAACHELRRFEEENRGWPPHAPQARPLVENTLTTLSVLLLLAIFHNLVQLDLSLPGLSSDWAELGKAQAASIREGEWWRLITALTLHSDWVHLAGNLAIGGIFITFLGRELGSGLSWVLLISAGALGNLANAWVQSPYHSSLGASTAVFAAVGILAALSLVRHRRLVRRRWLLPVAAALALLALLGSEGKNTDLGAHLFGLLFGALLGLGTEWLLGRYGVPSRSMNILLALVSASVVILAWWLALVVAGGVVLE